MPTATNIQIPAGDIAPGDIHNGRVVDVATRRLGKLIVIYSDGTTFVMPEVGVSEVTRSFPTWGDRIGKLNGSLDDAITEVIGIARSAVSGGGWTSDFKRRVTSADDPSEILTILGNVYQEAVKLRETQLWKILGMSVAEFALETGDKTTSDRAYLPVILGFISEVRSRKDRWVPPPDGNPVELAEYQALDNIMNRRMSSLLIIEQLYSDIREMVAAHEGEMDVAIG